MTAKQYLGELKRMDILIRQKREEIAMLEEQATCIPSLTIKPDIIQTSPDGEGFTKLIDKAAQLRAELRQDITQLRKERQKRIRQIRGLKNDAYVDILFERYVLFKSLDEIAKSRYMNYDYVRHLHGRALSDFQAHYKLEKESTKKHI